MDKKVGYPNNSTGFYDYLRDYSNKIIKISWHQEVVRYEMKNSAFWEETETE